MRRSAVVPIWDLSALPSPHVAGRLVLAAILTSVVLISAIAIVQALTWVNQPFAGFLVNERLVLGNIGQYHWTGSTAGLRWPDKVVRANGQPIASMRDLQAVAHRVPTGTPIAYTVEREAQRRDVIVPTMRFGWNDFVMTFGVTYVAGLIYLVVGLVVFLLKPDTKVSWAFFVACVSLSLFAITSFDIQSTHAGFIRIYLLVNTLWPAAFVHLALVFPVRREFIERRPVLQVAPYVVAIALTVGLELLYPEPRFLAIYQVVRLYGLVSALVVLASTLEATRQGRAVRRRAGVPTAGARLLSVAVRVRLARAHHPEQFPGHSHHRLPRLRRLRDRAPQPLRRRRVHQARGRLRLDDRSRRRRVLLDADAHRERLPAPAPR